MTARPLVSVLVPAYNGERFIEQTLRSAQRQTWENIEIVVADDCSTDATAEIVTEIARRDDRVRLITNPHNTGAWRNSSEIVRHARGQFVKLLLQDDVLHPEALQRLVEPLIDDETLAMATSKRGLIDEHGARVGEIAAMSATDGRLPGIAAGDTVLTTGYNTIGELSTTVLRTELARRSTWWSWGSRQFAANGDLWLWLQMLVHGDLWYVAEELSFFRQHATQRSQSRAIQIGGYTDWPDLLAGARQLGYLATAEDARMAWARVVANGASLLARLAGGDDRAVVARACQAALDAIVVGPTRHGLDDVEFVYRPAWDDPPALGRGVAAYLDAFRPDDPVTLVVVAEPGTTDLDPLLARIVRAISDRGRTPDDIPEIALVRDPGPVAPGRRRVVLSDLAGRSADSGDTPTETLPTPPTVPALLAAAASRSREQVGAGV
jgi:glycosyltransferase involved in cell wall biosynthesis